MKRIRTVGQGLVLAFLLVAAVDVQAQEKQATTAKMSLSLEGAQQYAVAYNRSLQNSGLDIKRSEASKWQSIASMLPQISVSADYSDRLGYKMDFGEMQIAMNPNLALAATASVAVSGAQIVGVQLTEIAKRMSDITYKQTEQSVKDQVKTIYYSILVMEQTIELLEKNLTNVEKLYNYTLEAVKVGVAEKVDADQIAVQVASMQITINNSKRSLEMLYNSLRLQLGATVDTEITLQQELPNLLNIEKALQLLSYDFILDKNYNYQLLQENVSMAKKQVQSSQWAYGPQLSAYYQYSYVDYLGKDAGMNMTPPNMIGISLKIPIFSSGSRYNAVLDAKYNYQQQKNNLDDTKNALLVQHSQLRYNLTSAFEAYEIQKKNVVVTQSVFDNISRKYEHGLTSSLEVTNASNNVISAQNSYMQSLMELVNAQIALEELLNL